MTSYIQQESMVSRLERAIKTHYGHDMVEVVHRAMLSAVVVYFKLKVRTERNTKQIIFKKQEVNPIIDVLRRKRLPPFNCEQIKVPPAGTNLFPVNYNSWTNNDVGSVSHYI